MAEPFKIGILFGDKDDRPPEEVGDGWDFAEIPITEQLMPLESHAAWATQREQLAAWNLPPLTVSSHFTDLRLSGPDVDWELAEFWTKRAFARLAAVGVQTVGVYGGFFRVPEGFSRTRATDQAFRAVDLMADHAAPFGITVALEPMADADTVWPTYREGLAFAKETGRPEVRIMADLNYFLKLDQPLDHIKDDPDYCVHCHIAGDGGQPGVGERTDVFVELFTILKDIGYEGGVSCACPWTISQQTAQPGYGAAFRYGVETKKTINYLRNLREHVYG